MSQSSTPGAPNAPEQRFLYMSEESFKRWLAVLISFVTLLVGVATLLQTQAGARAAALTRQSQDAAIRATGEQTRGQLHTGYDTFTVAAQYDELYTLAVRNRVGEKNVVGQAYLDTARQLRPLSPLLSESYAKYDESGFRAKTDYGRYDADTYVVTYNLLNEQRSAFADESSDWNTKADTFVAVIAILAVALFLFGLSSTLHGLVRLMFLVVGIVITGVSGIWMVLTYVQPVHHTPDEALRQFAAGKGYAAQASDYSTNDPDEYYKHANEYWQKAIDAYSESIKLAPDYASAYDARGLARLQLVPSQPKEAVEDLKQAIATGKEEYQTYWNYGAALYRNGEFDKVAAPSLKALEKNDKICGPHLNIALAMLAHGNADDAVNEYERAIKRCDNIYQDALKRGLRAPVSLWTSMQESVYELDDMLCVLSKTHCYPNRDLPNLDNTPNAPAVAEKAEVIRKRLKEALTALEFQGTTQVTPSGAKFDPLAFAYYMVDDKGNFTSYAKRTIFPYAASNPEIDVLTNYHNMNPDLFVVWKVFHNGQEEISLRYADKWNLEKDGPVVKKVNSWYIPAPGQYELEVYANGELLAVGSFEMSSRSELTNSLPTEARPSAPVQVDKLLFAENFDNNYANWWTGTAKYEQEGIIDGEFSMVTRAKNLSFSSTCQFCGSFTDFYYETDTRFIDGPTDFGYSLIYRGDTPLNNFYSFSIDADGAYNISKYANGWSFLVPWTNSPLINKKGTNKLGVMCRGTRCEFYVNGKLLTSVTDSSFTRGLVGVGVGNTDVHAAFDNVRVWSLK